MSHSHGEQAAKVGRPRKAVCVTCSERRSTCDGQPPRACTKCLLEKRVCRYPEGGTPRRSASPPPCTAYEMDSSGRHVEAGPPPASKDSAVLLGDPQAGLPASTMGLRTTPQVETRGGERLDSTDLQRARLLPETQHDRAERAASMDWTSAPLESRSTDETLAGGFMSTSWLTDVFLTATAGDQTSDLPWNLPQPSNQGSALDWDWGFTDLDADIFEPIATRPTSPAPIPAGRRAAVDVPEKEADLVMAVTAVEADGRTQANDVPESQSFESPWPNYYQPNTSEWSVELPPTSSPSALPIHSLPSPFLIPTKTINPAARGVMQTLTEHSHQPFWPTPDLGNFPSAERLTVCVNLYLSHFAAWLPILDSPRGTFRVDKAAPIVLKAMAAVGSAYSRSGEETLGQPLAELVRREIIFICEHDQRFIYELGIIQASLLQSCFGLFSGSPKLFQQAEINRASLVTASKRMRLLQWDKRSAASERASSAVDSEALDIALKRDHRRRRLGWAIFLFDAQLACLFGSPAQYLLADIDSPMPTVSPDASKDPLMFGEIMSTLLDSGILPNSLDDVARSCIAHTLYRLCLDATSLRSFAVPEGSPYSHTICSPYRQHPQQVLDQMARQLVQAPSTPTALAVSCAALAYHSHLQFTRHRLLETIRVAAGKSGSDLARETARSSLSIWMSSNPASTRNVFANAAMLGCLMSRFTFDTPAEVVWTFDAALCMWACLLFSDVMYLNSTDGALEGGGAVMLTWTTSSAVDSWIATGHGRLIIRGMGSSASLSAKSVLQTFADRLEVMSWGLAMRYRKVLLDLLQAPDHS